MSNLPALAGESGFGRWLGKGFWTITDQGLFATSNFILNILLARWLTPHDYGAFAVVFAGFLLLGLLHTALLVEPMLVFGPDKYETRLPEYLGALLYGHIVFSAACSLILLLIGLELRALDSQALSSALIGLAVAAPFILFQQLLRRACYIHFNPQLAALGGALYMTLMLTGAYLLYQSENLSAHTAFMLMGFAGLLAGTLFFIWLRVRFPSLRSDNLPQESFRDHWSYGRWSVANRAVSWVTESSYLLFLPIFSGLEASAAMRALTNLMMPAIQTYWSLSYLFLPSLVQVRGEMRFKRIVYLALAIYLASAVAYWLVLGLMHRPLVTWIYDGRYAEYASLLWFLGLFPLFAGAAEVLSTALRALRRVDQVFWAAMLSATVTLTVGLGALFLLGVAGAVVWILVAWSTATVALAWFFWSQREAWAIKNEMKRDAEKGSSNKGEA